MNLLFIQADQLSANAVGYAGCPYVRTPNLDRLAARSLNFTAAYCAFPKCVPSRTALLYGRMPHEIMLPGTELDYGARPGDPARGVRPEFRREELGHWFGAAGYDCVYAGKWHVGQWGPTESLEPEFASGFRALCRIDDPAVPAACGEYFRDRDRARPFLMVASFDNPHNICEYALAGALPWGNLPAPPGPADLPPFPGNGFAHPSEPAMIRQLQRAVAERLNYRPDDWRRYRWAYYRLVEKVDAEIGRLLDALAAAGLAEETAILFTTDHGDLQGAHLLAQKDTFHEESAHVPFLLALPGRAGGDATELLVNNGLDTYPTLCELAGIAPPPDFLGRSLLGAAAGQPPARRYIAAELKARFGGGEARMIRTRRHKYIAYDRGPHREQLFDLAADPGETVNLATAPAAHADLLRQHRDLLREWLARTADPFGEPHYCHPGKRDAIPGDEWWPAAKSLAGRAPARIDSQWSAARRCHNPTRARQAPALSPHPNNPDEHHPSETGQRPRRVCALRGCVRGVTGFTGTGCGCGGRAGCSTNRAGRAGPPSFIAATPMPASCMPVTRSRRSGCARWASGAATGWCGTG